MDETDTSPLSPAILRGLGDRSYDKRKAASVEVTNVIKSIADDKTKIYNVIKTLTLSFTESKVAHQRKGGLIGLAACAIGLSNDIDKYLDLLIPPVIKCFDDTESRICYYACEAMYNISKVARAGTLRYFNQIFDGLCIVSKFFAVFILCIFMMIDYHLCFVFCFFYFFVAVVQSC